MTRKQTFKILLDLVMTISMPVLMAYELVSSVVHEWLGLVVFLLFLAHHGLNLGWHRAIGKGRYHALRRVSLIVDLLLGIVMILLPISGLLLSEHMAPFLSVGRGIGTARGLHLALSYWGYVLMGFHIGLHGNMIMGWIRGKKMAASASWKQAALRLLAIAAALYGGYGFVRRQFADYMFLRNQFVFFDFSEPLVGFFLDYAATLWLFACMGYIVTLILKKRTGHVDQTDKK